MEQLFYKYQMEVKVASVIEEMEEFFFQINLRENMVFQIAECYVKIIKNHDYKFEELDRLLVCFYSKDKDVELAKNKLIEAIEFLVFLTAIPYETNNKIQVSEKQTLPKDDHNLSRKKMEKIDVINEKYRKIKGKKALLRDTLHLFYLGTKFNYIFDMRDSEEAFFAYFKILEKVAKDEYKSEEKSLKEINTKEIYTQEYVDDMIQNVYKIESTKEHKEVLYGKIRELVRHELFDGIYHKIIWFAGRHKIEVDPNEISEILDIRNDIAHGNKVDISKNEELYRKTIMLARKTIDVKFFGMNVSLPSKVSY